MENEKSTARDNDLEIVEIAEFKRDNTHKKIAKHEERQRQRRRRFYGILTVFALGFLAAILSCIFVLQMPVVVVCVVLVHSCRSSIWSVIPDDCWGDCISGSGSGIVWIAECSS